MSRFILLWEDRKGKFHQVDAMEAIPKICEEMDENLESYKTVTFKKKKIKLHKTPKSHLRKMIP